MEPTQPPPVRRPSTALLAGAIPRALRGAVVGISVVVITGSLAALAVFVFAPDVAEEFTSGLRPSLFYAPLPEDDIDAELEPRYAGIFAVAHNSGDSVSATLAALGDGADAIEIDVVSLDGELYSSHAPPLPLIGGRLFRGPRLEAVWAAAAQTDLVKFDLKINSRRSIGPGVSQGWACGRRRFNPRRNG